MNRKPAILGGKPIAEDVIHITQPTLFSPDEISRQLSDVFATGQITNAKYVEILEEEAAHYLGSNHAVALSSCTSGLMLVEQALGLKSEVILPSFTFSATAHSLLWNQLEPVFVDCEKDSHNINPRLVEEAITPRTSAILAVDVFGNPCNRELLQRIAEKRNLKLIIDAAHSFGSLYRGQKIGLYDNVQVFSLSPTKVVTAGEGGIVATNSKSLANRLRLARNYGNPENYDCEFPGLNARMMEINAIIGLKSFAMVEENISRRNRLVELYKTALSSVPGISFQRIHHEDRSTYKDFSILTETSLLGLNRDALSKALAAENIETRAYFSPPVHLQKAYRGFTERSRRKLPITEEVSSTALSLPLYSHMPEEHIHKICRAIESIHKYAEEIKAALSREQ